ncbi:GNAT family N-acetyltransferase [Arcticibacter sp. MXS-1]|jgi:putative acetyltransferase|uniref:GNAT family N-acetyltransferase n=1 Tax=Arcticibacter sp. MXS-1 TaxID=3341726 RepID=UPI002A41EA75|nr:GNAT family N-acetyltransferase [Bacteroidota bacterium]
MTNDFVNRKGQLDDLKEMQKLFVDTITAICKTDYDSDQILAWISGVHNKQRWDDILTKQFVLVAQHADKIVGFATLDSGNYIDLFYVHKDHQRQGIAQRLLDEIETEAKRLKQTTLTSDVSITARPFFEKNDFNVLREQTVQVKNVSMTNYKMTKHLTK